MKELNHCDYISLKKKLDVNFVLPTTSVSIAYEIKSLYFIVGFSAMV